jgi:hypothetical protein
VEVRKQSLPVISCQALGVHEFGMKRGISALKRGCPRVFFPIAVTLCCAHAMYAFWGDEIDGSSRSMFEINDR